MSQLKDNQQDPRLVAAVDLIARTGATRFDMRYSEDDSDDGDPGPVVWIAIATYADRKVECAASVTPLRAVLRLAETLIDGGTCTHCKRPTGIEPDSIETMPLDKFVCWYQFDPGSVRFVRGCAT